MTEIRLDDPELAAVPLVADSRTTLGGRGTEAPDEPDDRISLGRPVCVALPPDLVDADAQVFLQGRPQSQFCLLALTCSFRADDDAPIERAWIEVRLETQAPEGSDAPIAWSMEPLSVSDPMHVEETAKLDASLKLTTPLVPVELGPSVGREKKVVIDRPLPWVEAHREGTSRPSWIFSRTAIVDVRGPHRLRTVVELPAGATGQAEISAGASLRLKALGLIPYRARLDRLPEHQKVTLTTS